MAFLAHRYYTTQALTVAELKINRGSDILSNSWWADSENGKKLKKSAHFWTKRSTKDLRQREEREHALNNWSSNLIWSWRRDLGCKHPLDRNQLRPDRLNMRDTSGWALVKLALTYNKLRIREEKKNNLQPWRWVNAQRRWWGMMNSCCESRCRPALGYEEDNHNEIKKSHLLNWALQEES